MHSNKADLYFLEELTNIVGKERSIQWLMVDAMKSLGIPSTTRSPPSNGPRNALGKTYATTRRSFSAPEAEKSWRKNEFSSRSGFDPSIQIPEVTNRSSSTSSHIHRLHGRDAQQLSNLSLLAGDAEYSNKMGLVFTDAAHSVLDIAN